MRLFGWIRKDERARALRQWRNDWTALIEQGVGEEGALRSRLATLADTEPDVEVELEMLDALDQLRALQHGLAVGDLPTVETQHRIIGAEPCHFTAPSSIPTDHSHTAGRLLLTRSRAVFVGAGRTASTPWHMVYEVARVDRDVVFVRTDQTPIAHYRFNTYADAILCACLASHLKAPRRARL